MLGSDISYRKFSRKVESDGIRDAFVDSGELLVRKFLSPPVYTWLVNNDLIATVDRESLKRMSDNIIEISGQPDLDPERFVAELELGHILPTTGLSFTKDWKIIEESVGPPDLADRFVRESIVRHDRLSEIKITPNLISSPDIDPELIKKGGMMAPLSPRYYNYYHWLIQTLPKLQYIMEYEQETGNEVTVLLPPGGPPWIEETLDMLGWPEQKTERGTYPVYRAKKLIIPSYPPVHRTELQWLCTRLLSHVEQNDHNSNLKIFISRSNAIERRIANEKALTEFLTKEGFRIENLENNSVAKNIGLFDNAEVIIGAHGAGLTDIIFCEDCKVIELFGSKVKWHYKRLSEKLNLDYEPIHCEPESTDIVVDIDDLRRQL